METEIRLVTEESLTELEPLFAAYQRFYEVEDIDKNRNRKFFSRFIGSNHSGWLLGAWQGERIVGFGCYYRHKSSLSATSTILMNDLYVVEDARGAGIGRSLIEAGLEIAREAGASCLEWSTAPDNHRAQVLYDSTGAEKSTWLSYELKV
jgi:ribosomal protein S18 acetylase RimI-like enzyme